MSDLAGTIKTTISADAISVEYLGDGRLSVSLLKDGQAVVTFPPISLGVSETWTLRPIRLEIGVELMAT